MSAIEPDGSGGWYIAGYFNPDGDGFNGVEHLSSTGDLLWRQPVNGQVSYITIIDGALILSGGFGSVGNISRAGLAAIDSGSGELLPWNPQMPGTSHTYFDTAYGDGVVYVGEVASFTGAGPIRAVSYPSGVVRPFNVFIAKPFREIDYYDGFVLTSSGAFNDLGEGVEEPCLHGDIGGRWQDILFSGGVGCDLSTGSQVFSGPAGDHVSSDGESVFVATGSTLRSFDFATGADRGWLVQANRPFSDIAVSGPTVAALASGASSIGIIGRDNLAAIDGDGHLTPWNPSADGTVRSLAADGADLVIGGDFTQVGGVDRGRLARVDLATGSLGDWSPNADGSVNAVDVAGAVTYVGGSFTTVDAESHARLAAIAADGHPVSSFVATANSTVTTVEAAGDRLYVGGAFSRVGGESRSRLAAVDMATGAVDPWNPGADDFVRSIAATDDTVYVGGAFTAAGGQQRNRVAAIDPATGTATPWDPGSDNQVWALSVEGDIVYLGGMFTAVAGQPRSSLAAVTAAGALIDWDPSPTGAVYALATTGGGVSAAGLFGTAAAALPIATGASEATGRQSVQAEVTPGDATSLAFAAYPNPASPVDVTDPTVNLATPPPAATYSRNQAVNASFSCADEAGGSGIASCVGTAANGSPINTSTLGSHDFTVTATDAAGNQHASTHTYTVADAQPDGRVKLGATGTYKGDGVYNSTGADQTRSTSASPGHTVTYYLSAQNDAPFADTLRVRGTASTSRYAVKYTTAGNDITSQVVAGTYTTPTLAPGTSQTIKVVVTVRNAAPVGSSLTATLTTRSITDPTRRDTVKLITRRT